jgi:hypothetical protein
LSLASAGHSHIAVGARVQVAITAADRVAEVMRFAIAVVSHPP